jgi:hypothetical protein
MLSISLKVAFGGVLVTNLATPLPDKIVTIAGWGLGICVFITAYAESRVKK